MSTFIQPPTYIYIDPYEIQCWPPKEVEDAIAQAGIEYPDLLEGVAALLLTRSPRFAQDLAPYMESYFHPHNLDRPLSPVEDAGLRSMMANPESLVVDEFKRLVPMVLLKATTLAVETFIQNRPSWVLKAVPQFSTIKQAIIA